MARRRVSSLGIRRFGHIAGWEAPAGPLHRPQKQMGEYRHVLGNMRLSVQFADAGRARHGRHRTSPALHVTRKTRSRRLGVAPLHHGASRCTMEHHDATGVTTPRQTVKASRTGINGCSAMAHPLTHLTHGIPTRRPFHPAKTASEKTPRGRPAALHVTDDTARHLRYTSRAKREADVSLSHRCTMEPPLAPWSTTRRRLLPPRDRR